MGLVDLIYKLDPDHMKAVDKFNDWAILHKIRYRKNYKTMREYRVYREKSFRRYVSLYYNINKG